MSPLLWTATAAGQNAENCGFPAIAQDQIGPQLGQFCHQNQIKSLTLYAFSSENWNRPEQEVHSLMELFVFALDNEVKVCTNTMSDYPSSVISAGSARVCRSVSAGGQVLTANNTGLQLNIAANYGGRWDITHSVKQVIAQVQCGELSAEDVSEQDISRHISLHDQPPIDLGDPRTGGEHRISNFLLWQVAYAEFYFTEVLGLTLMKTHSVMR